VFGLLGHAGHLGCAELEKDFEVMVIVATKAEGLVVAS